MAKSFNELLENYQEFMKLLQEKVQEVCGDNGDGTSKKYNAFKDDGNCYQINILEDRIFIDVIDGYDHFEYDLPFYMFTKNENDIKLFNLGKEKKDIENKLHYAHKKLKDYTENLNSFIELSKVYGVVGASYDIVKVEQDKNKYSNKIKKLKIELSDINSKIEKLKG